MFLLKCRFSYSEKNGRGFKPVYVIPHEKERENVEEYVGDDTSIVFITTPGQVSLSLRHLTCIY